jgi:hypothetical protein
MSNLWKLYGLAYSRQDFYDEAVALAAKVRPRDFQRDPSGQGNDPYHHALVDIDKFLFKWYCPLGHLDVQLFYDLLCCQTLWDNFAKVLKMSGLDTSRLHPGDPAAGVFWQVLGLACLDPWKNADEDGKTHVGFRQLLQQDIAAASRFGFHLTDSYKKMISDVLNKPEMLDALQGIAMCWFPGSEAMLLHREEYARFEAVEVPPGWIDLAKR